MQRNNPNQQHKPPVEAPVETKPIVEQPPVEAPVEDGKVSEMQAEIDRLKAELAEKPVLPVPQASAKPVQVSKKTAGPQVDDNGNVFGEFDTDKKYPFPANWMGSVVVTQYNTFTAPSNTVQIDEGSRRLMPYETASFNKLVKDQGFEDVQYFILHDPR